MRGDVKNLLKELQDEIEYLIAENARLRLLNLKLQSANNSMSLFEVCSVLRDAPTRATSAVTDINRGDTR